MQHLAPLYHGTALGWLPAAAAMAIGRGRRSAAATRRHGRLAVGRSPSRPSPPPPSTAAPAATTPSLGGRFVAARSPGLATSHGRVAADGHLGPGGARTTDGRPETDRSVALAADDAAIPGGGGLPASGPTAGQVQSRPASPRRSATGPSPGGRQPSAAGHGGLAATAAVAAAQLARLRMPRPPLRPSPRRFLDRHGHRPSSAGGPASAGSAGKHLPRAPGRIDRPGGPGVVQGRRAGRLAGPPGGGDSPVGGGVQRRGQERRRGGPAGLPADALPDGRPPRRGPQPDPRGGPGRARLLVEATLRPGHLARHGPYPGQPRGGPPRPSASWTRHDAAGRDGAAGGPQPGLLHGGAEVSARSRPSRRRSSLPTRKCCSTPKWRTTRSSPRRAAFTRRCGAVTRSSTPAASGSPTTSFPTAKSIARARGAISSSAIDLRLPKRIYNGKHTLQLTVEDLKSHKVGQSSIDLRSSRAARSSSEGPPLPADLRSVPGEVCVSGNRRKSHPPRLCVSLSPLT